jgi:hypothetical protein
MDDREMARIEKAARRIGERGWSTWARRVLLQLADEILARGVR